MASGYILLARSMDKSEVAKMPPCTRELWTYLLRMVNYADNGKFKRGQGFFSLEEIQSDLAWWVGYRRATYSKPDLTKALRRLREGNMIETTKEVRGVTVTVCKYDYYQDPSNYEGNAKETRRKEYNATSVRTILEEGKKEKKESKKGVAPVAQEPLMMVWPKWAGPQTLAAWEKFKGHKLAHHKFRYKSGDSEQSAINLLARYYKSGKECVEGLEEAMAKGHMFPVDPAGKFKPANGQATPTPTYGKAEAEAEEKAIREKYGRDPVWGPVYDSEMSAELIAYNKSQLKQQR